MKNMIIELLTFCRDVIFHVNVSQNFTTLNCCTQFFVFFFFFFLKKKKKNKKNERKKKKKNNNKKTSVYLDCLLKSIYVKALQDLKKYYGNAVTLLFIFLHILRHKGISFSKYITKTRLFKYIENFTTKTGNFSDKRKSLIFFILLLKHSGYSLQPTRRGGSNEYPQSMFLNRNKKNNVYPCKPQFYHIKVGFKGVKIT